MGLEIVSDLGVGRGEEMSLEAGLEDGEGLRVTNMLGEGTCTWFYEHPFCTDSDILMHFF